MGIRNAIDWPLSVWVSMWCCSSSCCCSALCESVAAAEGPLSHSCHGKAAHRMYSLHEQTVRMTGCELMLSPTFPAGEEPVKRPAPASSALAWETLSAREKAASRRGRSAPSHAATEPRGTKILPLRARRPSANCFRMDPASILSRLQLMHARTGSDMASGSRAGFWSPASCPASNTDEQIHDEPNSPR